MIGASATRGASELALITRSGERDQVRKLFTPDVLDAVWQQQDAFGRQRLDGALIVRDEHDRAAVATQRAEDLFAARWVEVVRRLVEQQHVGARHHEASQRKAGLLTTRPVSYTH